MRRNNVEAIASFGVTRPFAAFAVENLGLDKDLAELRAWEGLGLSTNEVGDLLKRDADLDIQDGELETTILDASDQFNRGVFCTAVDSLAYSVDRAIAILQAAKNDPAMQREFQVETDTPLGKIFVGGGGRTIVHQRRIPDHRHGWRRCLS